MESDRIGCTDRSSHNDFFYDRDYEMIKSYWKYLVSSSHLPLSFKGCLEYGITDLEIVSKLGAPEYSSEDPRYKRRTYAMVISYDGSKYSGFQQQKGSGLLCVEDDIEKATGRKVTAAGRTDKGVSAICQVVSFKTYDEISEKTLIEEFLKSEPCVAGRLGLRQCFRVPKKFNALFSATWRRYIYLFPLKFPDEFDVSFVNQCLQMLENKELPYNAFAHRENRSDGTESSTSDLCTLYRARAERMSLDQLSQPTESSTVVEESDNSEKKWVIFIELIGSRFLRRMVRILVATVLRESMTQAVRNVNCLVDLALSGKRDDAALGVPPWGLAMAGVGYDLQELSISKYISSKSKNSNEAKKKARRQENNDNAVEREDRT